MSLCRWLQTSTYCFWWIWYTSHATGHWFIGLLVQIKLNSRKCAAVRFSLSSTGEPSYSIENVPISVSQSHRDLGVLSDNYSHICSRAYCKFVAHSLPWLAFLSKRGFTSQSFALSCHIAHSCGDHISRKIFCFWKESNVELLSISLVTTPLTTKQDSYISIFSLSSTG